MASLPESVPYDRKYRQDRVKNVTELLQCSKYMSTKTGNTIVCATLLLSLCMNFWVYSKLNFVLGQLVSKGGIIAPTGRADENGTSSVSDYLTSEDSDPCHGRPTPEPLAGVNSAPTVYFLHLPKSAGSTATGVLKHYANVTKGVGCAYLQDGESVPADRFQPDGIRLHEEMFSSLGNDSIPYQMASAIRLANITEKLRLMKIGGCRTVRGHATLGRLQHIESPVFLFTILRDPIERFISMYDYGKKTQMRTSAWSNWMHQATLSEELDDATSVLHLPFADDESPWISTRGQWISFFFYGVLNQMSGVTPRFTGAGDINKFAMTNAKEMADVAKNYMCRMHLIGFQENTSVAIESAVNATHQWANYTELYRKHVLNSWVNLTPNKTSRNPIELLRDDQIQLLRNRLAEEYEVFEFSKRIVRYRGSLFAPGVFPLQ